MIPRFPADKGIGEQMWLCVEFGFYLFCSSSGKEMYSFAADCTSKSAIYSNLHSVWKNSVKLLERQNG